VAEEPNNTPSPSTYEQQLADTLAANRKEQEDVTAQLASLQERLTRLREHETWLANSVQETPPTTAAPTAAEPVGERRVAEGEQPESNGSTSASDEAGTEAAVPKPRQSKRAMAKESTSSKKTAAPKATATAKKTTAKKAAAKKTTSEKTAAKKTAAKQRVEPLHKLILNLLVKTPGQPRLAREVLDDLAKAHPDRKTGIQVVRNNLDTLAKKGTIEKMNQQGSAMYTAHVPAEDAPGAETDQESETVGQQAPAAV
jgi:hypothetical protein